MLLGINGFSRSGKDETADILVRKYNFERRAFADPLRSVLLEIVRCTHLELADSIDQSGWDVHKQNFPWLVDQMIALGAGMRRHVNPDVWLDGVLREPYSRLVVPDVRHENEFDAIKELGGEVWKILREGTQPRAMDNLLQDKKFDKVIENNGTLEELEERVDYAMIDLILRYAV